MEGSRFIVLLSATIKRVWIHAMYILPMGVFNEVKYMRFANKSKILKKNHNMRLYGEETF